MRDITRFCSFGNCIRRAACYNNTVSGHKCFAVTYFLGPLGYIRGSQINDCEDRRSYGGSSGSYPRTMSFVAPLPRYILARWDYKPLGYGLATAQNFGHPLAHASVWFAGYPTLCGCARESIGMRIAKV